MNDKTKSEEEKEKDFWKEVIEKDNKSRTLGIIGKDIPIISDFSSNPNGLSIKELIELLSKIRKS